MSWSLVSRSLAVRGAAYAALFAVALFLFGLPAQAELASM